MENNTEELPSYIQRYRKIYNRYQRNYTIIVLLGLAAVIAIFVTLPIFYGITALAFGLWSCFWYENGAQENCIDEWKYAHPKDGFRRMFNSWKFFLLLAAIAYFFCQKAMPWLF